MSRQPQKPADNRNLLIAVLLSALVLMGADYLRLKYYPPIDQAAQQAAEQAQLDMKLAAPKSGNGVRVQTAAEVKRLPIQSTVFHGQIATRGGRIDALDLPGYQTAIDDKTPVSMFRPDGDDIFYYTAGWSAEGGISAPDGDTVWQTASKGLTPETPVTLTWQNESGLVFTRTYRIEPQRYIVLVSDRVENAGQRTARLTHHTQLYRGVNDERLKKLNSQSSFTHFIGPMAVFDKELNEFSYADLKEGGSATVAGQHGWAGFSTPYFLAAAVAEQDSSNEVDYRYIPVGDKHYFRMDMRAPSASVVAPGEVVEKNYRLYVGPQSIRELEKENFDLHRAVDFGWYHAIANIFHEVMLWLKDLVGNMGIAIILLTILIKIMLWPLASKSYRSMAALKKLHPKVEALKKKYGENQRDKMAMEMMALYREHRVNPMSGCWPMLIQIPIFFALYKVVLISFEFRQAPFYGWIEDLSIADPFYVLPILMGLTMVLQQRLSPPITDPVQQKVFKFMPVLFTVMFLTFPAGLVLYWTVNSILSIGQQWLITRRVEELG